MDDCEVQSSVVNEVLTLKGFVSDHGEMILMPAPCE